MADMAAPTRVVLQLPERGLRSDSEEAVYTLKELRGVSQYTGVGDRGHLLCVAKGVWNIDVRRVYNLKGERYTPTAVVGTAFHERIVADQGKWDGFQVLNNAKSTTLSGEDIGVLRLHKSALSDEPPPPLTDAFDAAIWVMSAKFQLPEKFVLGAAYVGKRFLWVLRSKVAVKIAERLGSHVHPSLYPSNYIEGSVCALLVSHPCEGVERVEHVPRWADRIMLMCTQPGDFSDNPLHNDDGFPTGMHKKRKRFPGLRVVRPAALWHGRQLGFDRFPLDLQQHVLVNTARECMAKACEGNLQHLLTLRAVSRAARAAVETAARTVLARLDAAMAHAHRTGALADTIAARAIFLDHKFCAMQYELHKHRRTLQRPEEAAFLRLMAVWTAKPLDSAPPERWFVRVRRE